MDQDEVLLYHWQTAWTELSIFGNIEEPRKGFPRGTPFEWGEADGPDGQWKLVAVSDGRLYWTRAV